MGSITFRILGFLILSGVVLQLGFQLIASWRRYTFGTAQRRRSLELLDARIRRAHLKRKTEQLLTEWSWQGCRKFEVHRKTMEGKSGICSFELAPHDGKRLPPFQPGQYLTFELSIPGQKGKTVRCYSLSDCYREQDGRYRVTIKKALPPPGKDNVPPGLASSYFHDQVQEGDLLDVKAPAGSFVLDTQSATPVVLLAGGVGITPMLSMLNAIVDSGLRRETWFFYGVRNGDEHIMRAHLDRIRFQCDHVHIHVCYSQPGAADKLDRDYDHSGFVCVDLLKEWLPSNEYEFYICGPPPMMKMLTSDLKEWGVPEDRVRFEAFGPASVKSTKKTNTTDQAETGPASAKVAFAKSGKVARWTPDGGSLLELAEANGVEISSGCRAGSCGTCKVAVREGKISYANPPAADCEPGSCLACVALPQGDVTLDA
ncbi:MAG: 2Fe-2S iron-sulfur cluster-binding protein [Phycisphaerae bacterium]